MFYYIIILFADGKLLLFLSQRWITAGLFWYLCVYKHWKCKQISKGNTVHGSLNEIIWVCYLPLGWSENISMPVSFLSLFQPILFSFKHIHVIHMMTCMSMSVCCLFQMHECVSASWISTSLFLRKPSAQIF